ncbi:Ubiquitin carboxyl-terminal hydrolase CYLD, partial [Trichinella sp. T9]
LFCNCSVAIFSAMSLLNDSSSAYILLKTCKGRIALRKGRFEQVEVEPGCIFELDNSEHCSVGSQKMNLTLKSLDVRGLFIECPSYYVDAMAKRHACLLLACSDFQERLKLYSDSEQLEKLLRAKAGEHVRVAMNDGTYIAAIVHSVKPIKLDSPAVYFEVEPEGSLNGTAFPCNRFFVSFDRISVPERVMHTPPAAVSVMTHPVQPHRENNSVRSADLELEFAELSTTKGFGNLDSGHVAHYTPCLCSNDLAVLIGKPKGIQGHSNSCYMDAALFSMFSCCNAFDSYLLHCRKDMDVKRKHVVDVLRCDIVYPLRKYQYVRADRVMEFRRLITEIAPDMKGFMEEEKDVEEFLNLLFGRICQVEPDIKLSSYLFQLICSDQQPSSQSCKTVVSVQQLLEQSFFDLNILLKRIPTRFILQILRYGKERLYRDPHVCWKCSSLADLQCLECYLTETHWLNETFFCFNCFREFIRWFKKYKSYYSARDFMRSSCLMSVSTNALSSLFDCPSSPRPIVSWLGVPACQSKARYRQTNWYAFSRNLSYATSTSYAALRDVPIFRKNFFITRSCCEESQYFNKELKIEQTCSSCSSIEKYLRMLRLGGCMNNGKIVPKPPTSTSLLQSNESSYLFQLICSDQQPSSQSCKTVVSVQQLLEQSFFDLNILLKRIPTRFILQIPRYGKERLYRGVLPSLQLDISSILLCHPHVCWKCSSLADLQCLECYLTETHWLNETFFCFNCFR